MSRVSVGLAASLHRKQPEGSNHVIHHYVQQPAPSWALNGDPTSIKGGAEPKTSEKEASQLLPDTSVHSVTHPALWSEHRGAGCLEGDTVKSWRPCGQSPEENTGLLVPGLCSYQRWMGMWRDHSCGKPLPGCSALARPPFFRGDFSRGDAHPGTARAALASRSPRDMALRQPDSVSLLRVSQKSCPRSLSPCTGVGDSWAPGTPAATLYICTANA